MIQLDQQCQVVSVTMRVTVRAEVTVRVTVRVAVRADDNNSSKQQQWYT